MTVLAWDGHELAADKRVCFAGMHSTVTKIFRVGKCLVGGAGYLPTVLAMVEWVREGRDPTRFPGAMAAGETTQVLVIEPTGDALIYERTPQPIRYEHPHVTLGTGCQYARAALFFGKTATQAVEAACELDPLCGNGVDTLTLE